MDSVEWLERLEDFLCISRVPLPDHGMVARYLLSDIVRRELYPAGQTRENSFEEFKKRLLGAIRLQEPANLTKARRLVSKVMRAEEDFHQRQQTHIGNPKPEKTEATQHMDDLICEVNKISLKLEKRGVDDRTTRREKRRLFQLRWLGPPLTRLPTRNTPTPRTANRHTERQTWESQGVVYGRTASRRSAMCKRGVGVVPLQLGRWRGRVPVMVVRNLAVLSVLGTNSFDSFVRTVDWLTREITMTDGSKASIGCAVVAKPRSVAPDAGAGTDGPEDWTRALHTLEMREGHFAWRCRPWTNEPCKAPHRDRGGPAGEAATPPPSSSPAGGGGPVNPGNAARGGNRTSLKPLEFTSSAGSEKDGSPRFCVGYRRLNAVTRVDAQPIPRINDTLDALAGAKWFITLDLASGYWQVEVAERHREKTAFFTPLGLFQFQFGLCNAPATFQRLMEKALRGLTWKTCLVYLDDIIVFRKTEEEHLERLEGVLSRLQSVGLKIKSEKCQLMRQSVHYLGHIVTQHGVGTDPEKTAAVQEWPTPQCVREVRQFLGLASYYRQFVRNFAGVANRLHALTKKGEKWRWGLKEEEAFARLKDALVSPLILVPPRLRPHSPSGCGCQRKRHQSSVVAARRAGPTGGGRVRLPLALTVGAELLRDAEGDAGPSLGYSPLRPYLYGRKFTARTDYSSLKWLRNFREPVGQIIAKRFHLLYADSRLADLRVFGDARCPTQEYVSSADSRYVTMEMVEPVSSSKLSVTSFPLCMRRLYDELKSAHHLRHGGRMQLGLFLKKIGLSLNESLKFWEYHFRPKIDAEKFQRQYAYSIRHNYGEEGKRADYVAYSCLKIIMNNPPGIGDFHGSRCPFKHCDAEHLQQLLKNCGIHKDDIKNIVNYASNNHYNKACSIFFDCMHKLPEGGLGEFITHPNQYFDESRKLYSRSSSKKRFPILHAM
ncbi:DNA primase large subunit [Trichinella spiralis]|uniref:RNA-directed DNA polymerase n=2 Tax=Trichinella spiralis TaxID=6334 RepID=A0A0V1AQX4_TRISP|nr:DNA primase large subunit [Trichinella spiralis]